VEDAKPMEKNKTMEINQSIKKNGGFFANSFLKLKEMESCPCRLTPGHQRYGNHLGIL
jgi:hypothetical protein